jgi:PAS domain-containing protein
VGLNRDDGLAPVAGEDRPISWRSDVTGKWDRFSQGWCDFTGRTFGQELDDGWLEGMHPEDIVTFLPIYLDVFRRRVPFEVGVRLLHRDGTWHRIQIRGSPSFDAAGAFLGFAGSCAPNSCRMPGPSSSGEGPSRCSP